MLRTTLFCVALVLTATVGQAKQAKAPPGRSAAPAAVYHVYSSGCKSAEELRGTYQSLDVASRLAAQDRAKLGLNIVVTTGTAGKGTGRSQPARYLVYWRGCSRSDWQLRETITDSTGVELAVATHKKKGGQVEVVHDYTPAQPR
jgi:hypothetical protein